MPGFDLRPLAAGKAAFPGSRYILSADRTFGVARRIDVSSGQDSFPGLMPSVYRNPICRFPQRRATDDSGVKCCDRDGDWPVTSVDVVRPRRIDRHHNCETNANQMERD
jgi:hypothetical protein